MSAAWARGVAPLAWIALLASVAVWPLVPPATGPELTLIAGLPLLLPLPGILRGARTTLRWAPLTLAPALAIALMEIVASRGARFAAAWTLALILAAFAAVIAAQRAPPRP
jgi:uncharacterized membrane protein